MTNRALIEEIYINDGLRNRNFLKKVLHKDVLLEWNNSNGLKIMNREDLLNFADELKLNFVHSKVSITHLIEDNNTFCVKYNYQISPIENPSEIISVAKIVVIWEFKNNKLIKGYQLSYPS